MKIRALIIAILLTLGSTIDVHAQDNTDSVKTPEQLQAEIDLLKQENEKLKTLVGDEKLKQVEANTHLKFRDKILRPLGKDWYLNVAVGYGMPFLATNKRSPLKQIGDKDWYQNKGDLSVKPLFGTNGGGFAINVGWGHMFNKHIGIDVLHTIAWHPESLDASINTTSNTPLGEASYYATQKTSTFGIYISPHLVMRWDNGKRFGMTAKAGLAMPIFGSTVSRAYIDDKAGRIIETLSGYPVLPIPFIHQTLQATAKTSYHPTIGVSTSIGFDVKVSPKVWLYAETRIQAYTIKLKQTVMNEFSMTTNFKLGGLEIPLSVVDGLIEEISGGILDLSSLTGGLPLNIASAAEAPIFLTHYNYVDEITEESNTARYGTKSLIAGPLNLEGLPAVDLNKPMDEPGQRFNASTLYFNIGLRFYFDLWDKKRRESFQVKHEK